MSFNEACLTILTDLEQVMIVTRWREQALDSWSNADLKMVDFEDFFNPYVYVDNLLVERRSTITNRVHRDDSGKVYITESMNLRGVFTFKGTLDTFPFDVQVSCIRT